TARGSARITRPNLEKAVAGFPLNVSLPEIDLSAIRLDQNALDMGPFHLELPVIAEGMEYEALRVVDGDLHLTFTLNGDQLRLRNF
ncbi:MAG TPA: hypothetical protein VNP73_06175, partial [Actinomycetota bacterium]|nr:hypothetical protein [Actinomycetota bacterium]